MEDLKYIYFSWFLGFFAETTNRLASYQHIAVLSPTQWWKKLFCAQSQAL